MKGRNALGQRKKDSRVTSRPKVENEFKRLSSPQEIKRGKKIEPPTFERNTTSGGHIPELRSSKPFSTRKRRGKGGERDDEVGKYKKEGKGRR